MEGGKSHGGRGGGIDPAMWCVYVVCLLCSLFDVRDPKSKRTVREHTKGTKYRKLRESVVLGQTGKVASPM